MANAVDDYLAEDITAEEYTLIVAGDSLKPEPYKLQKKINQ